MQSRVSFNGGEYTPELGARADLDKYPMGCDVLENWDVGQFGGVKRRKGMKKVSSAFSREERLFPYVYSYADGDELRFLVELSKNFLRVFSPDGRVVALFQDGDKVNSKKIELNYEVKTVRVYQLNKLLFFTSLTHCPMVLSYDGQKWVFEEWVFKSRPWRYTHLELRDSAVTMTYDKQGYMVDFGSSEQAELAGVTKHADYLRVSHRTDRRTIKVSSDILSSVKITESMPDVARKGETFAIEEDAGCSYYVCIADFSADGYVEGLESPTNYGNAFRQVDAVKGFEGVTPINSLKSLGAVKKGTKIAFVSKYWKYWTCIKDFVLENDEGFDTFEQYPEHFAEGLAIGEAVPSRGTWAFKCSGIWYGTYEVRRCYEGDLLTQEWELRGTSTSYNDNPANNGIEGDEKEEECYLRLFVTRSRKLDDTLKTGFPAEMNHLELVVDSYVHDITLKAIPTTEPGQVVWDCVDLVKPAMGTRIHTKDWSWAAFSDRYGYPLLCDSYYQRLVFAGTKEQPLTLWLSRTDDLNNFLDGETEIASIALTISAVSQDPICWIKSRRNDLLLGTSSAEYVINTTANGGITSNNVRSAVHAHRGSDGQTSIASEEKVIFVGRGGKRVYEYGYNYESDGYISRELSLFAAHIGLQHGGIVRSSLAESPETVAYFVLGDGQLALCTYNSMQEVRTWHRWVTEGKILDVCVLPDGARNDSVYLLVERDVDVAIEVVKDTNPYVDEGGRDYTSTLITNTLHSPMEKPVRHQPNTSFALCFGEDCDLTSGEISISTDGGLHWYAVNSNLAVLGKGWHSDIVAWSANTFNRKFGMRVRGNRGMNLLAIQA